jgi:hypothetical protein
MLILHFKMTQTPPQLVRDHSNVFLLTVEVHRLGNSYLDVKFVE